MELVEENQKFASQFQPQEVQRERANQKFINEKPQTFAELVVQN